MVGSQVVKNEQFTVVFSYCHMKNLNLVNLCSSFAEYFYLITFTTTEKQAVVGVAQQSEAPN